MGRHSCSMWVFYAVRPTSGFRFSSTYSNSSQALFHALAALAWIGVSGPEWQRLARDGIVNILCQQAIKLTSYTETFPSLRQDMSKKEFDSVIEMLSS